MAQTNAPIEFDTINGYGTQLIINGQFDAQTTGMKNEMLQTLIFGGYIDGGMKDRSYNRHGDFNFAGLISNNDVTYFHRTDSMFHRPGLNWGVKAGYYAIGGGNYSKDAFGLVFYGNEPFLGDTAHFSGTAFNFMRFQKIGFGLRDAKSGSYVFLNFVNVQDAFKGRVRNGDLYQNGDASEIKMKLRGDMAYTQGNQFSKGWGLSVDAAYRFTVPWIKEKRTVIELSLNNIGFASMTQPMQYFSADSTYSFTGFQLNQLFGDASPFNRDDYSVLDSLGITRDSTYKRAFMLPGYIQVAKLVDFKGSTKWQSYFGIRLYPSLESQPSVYAGACYKPFNSWMLSANVCYGGFGVVRGGLTVNYIAPKVRLSLGTDDIVGAVYKGAYGKTILLRTVWELD